ncbi:hypothetical protein SASPL_136097 [Salvia splendens]|uniref:Uncharacterized protein n=1 Tax=Salvia splendens TaxID=180675 RepID=A0A8X8X1D0_SALSN|nr:hypothetical protein SASPL_136097 [Salvia splendens]
MGSEIACLVEKKKFKTYVLLIPGNPVTIESLLIDCLVSLLKNWESQRMFSLEEQINHKISFIEHELQVVEMRIILLTIKSDLEFIKSKRNQIAFLFGLDDHWGPLHIYEEVVVCFLWMSRLMRKQVPGACHDVEHEGYTHAFSCTAAGLIWVAYLVSNLIRNHLYLC